jgi:hypothetical protein
MKTSRYTEAQILMARLTLAIIAADSGVLLGMILARLNVVTKQKGCPPGGHGVPPDGGFRFKTVPLPGSTSMGGLSVGWREIVSSEGLRTGKAWNF